MQEPGKDGFFKIPLVGVEGEDLTSLMEAELPQDARIEARSRTPGVHMDAATAQIVVPAISSAVVAIIGAIATIWAAKVNSRAKPAAAPTATSDRDRNAHHIGGHSDRRSSRGCTAWCHPGEHEEHSRRSTADASSRSVTYVGTGHCPARWGGAHLH